MNPRNAGFFQPALTSRPAIVPNQESGGRLSSHAAAFADRAETPGMDPVRAAIIRGRILSGAYNTLNMVDTVARHLLDSGEF